MVKNVAITPTTAIIRLRLSILSCICVVVSFPFVSSVMQIISQRIQKFMPSTGKKRGIEAAYPFLLSGNSLRSPQGALMIGICAMATMMAMANAIQQLVPAIQRPTAAAPITRVDPNTNQQQYFLKALKRGGLMRIQKMLKELERRSTMVLLVWKYSQVSLRMAKYWATIMRRTVETRVTEKIKAQANMFIIQMSEGGDFFNVEVTDQLIESLDNVAFAQLLEVLQLNFQQEYQQLEALQTHKMDLTAEIAAGQSNLVRMGRLGQEHQKQKLKMLSELQLVQAQCQAAKKQLKNEQ